MMTNKIKTIFTKAILAIGFIGVIFSCSDELELEPETTWSADSFYDNESEVNIALAGIHSSSRVLDRMLAMDAGTDESYALKGWVEDNPENVYTHNETSQNVYDVWRILYIGINNANNLIKHMKPENFSEEDYNKYLGEARFMRAFFYYHLTTWWNEVPLRLEPTVDQNSNHKAPASTEEVYMQIIEDLTFAAEHLPLVTDGSYVAGHANKMAAHALLAKIYLKAGGYPLQATSINEKNPFEAAKEHCQVVMDAGHTLNDSYRDLFLGYIQNNYDFNESLFEIVFANGSDLGVGIAGKLGYNNGLLYKPNPRIGTPYADPIIQPSPMLELTYELGDLRENWNVPGISGVKNNKFPNGKVNALANPLTWGYCIGKFRRWEPLYPDDIDASNASETPIVVLESPLPLSATNTGINLPVLRYADVLLMFAEAVNELEGPTAEAVGAIDLIRERAGLEDLATAKPEAIADKMSFFDEIVDERLRELCFEGQRKADLVRWNLLEEKIAQFEVSIVSHPSYVAASHNSKIRSANNFDPVKHLSLPYPQQEVLINNLLEQKPEW